MSAARPWGSRPRLRRSRPYPIAELPPELKASHRPLLLFCGDSGGWRPGVWIDGGWRDYPAMQERLEPTHFALVSRATAPDGRWSAAGSGRRTTLTLVAAVVIAWAAMLWIGQLAYGDPWALCAPRSGLGEAGTPAASE